LASKAIEFDEKKRRTRVLRRSRSFKVIEDSINQKPVCDFLLVTNTNWYTISYRFGVNTAYCSNFVYFTFLGHRGTYDVHLRLIGKRVVDFLLVLIELFCWVLRLRGYERKQIENRRFASGWVSISQIFTRKGPPHQSFLHG